MIYRKSIKYSIEGSCREITFDIKAESEQQAFKILVKKGKSLVSAVEDDPRILKPKRTTFIRVTQQLNEVFANS